MLQLNTLNQSWRAKIDKFKFLTDGFEDTEGRLSIAISDVNTAAMVVKVLIVCDDAEEIWKEFNNIRPGIFTSVLQEEFGVGGNFAQKIIADFNKEIQSLQRAHEKQL